MFAAMMGFEEQKECTFYSRSAMAELMMGLMSVCSKVSMSLH